MTKLQLFILLISCACFSTVTMATPDAELPIQINSDKANFDQQQGLATYSGHVTVVQGSRHLTADKLTILRDANNKVQVIVATGKPAKFKSQADTNKPAGSGTANIIKYYPQKDKVDLLNNATLTQNGDTISGPKLSYNFATEELQGNSTKNERTTVILQPKRAP